MKSRQPSVVSRPSIVPRSVRGRSSKTPPSLRETKISVSECAFDLGYRMPAEWEPHAATWLAWPHEPTDWPGKFEAVPWVFAEVIKNLTRGERVRLIVSGKRMQKEASAALEKSQVDVRLVDFVELATDRSWTRDFLPLFVAKSGRPGKRALGAVKFRFNGWARYDNHARDEAAGLKVQARATAAGVAPFQAYVGGGSERLVLEGGAIDVDGEGTLLCTEECLLDGRQARNRELGKTGVEQALRQHLGAEKVLWLGRGIAGDDTAGHIDDFARFVAPGKIVLAAEKNRRDANYRPLREALERLVGAKDARGRRIEVIPLPMPEPVVFDEQRLPASYANFYIGNSVVLVPTFNDVADATALGILAELFPDRRVVGIYSKDFVLGLGTIHCSTQQEPK
ncbi:MAG TPA: agmatine deiminase family protein [Polyangiaceae bacterium]|nr:agmatine deiminase family protein [Polyangiaceae bacterium]